MHFDIDAIAAELTDDGDTYAVTVDSGAYDDWRHTGSEAAARALDDDGTWMFKLRIEPDEDMSLLDEAGEGVWCGRIEWGRWCRDYDRPHAKPDGWVNGRTVRLDKFCHWLRGTDVLWWEIPEDIPEDQIPEFRSRLVRLLEYGYVQIGVELTHERPDGYSRKWTEWLGGVDEPYPEAIAEQISEVIAQIEEREEVKTRP